MIKELLLIISSVYCLTHNVCNKEDIKRYLIKYSVNNNIDYSLVLALAHTESSFRFWVIGDKGKSYGLFQIQCPTARFMGFKEGCEQLLDYKVNTKYALKYLKWLIKKYGKRLGIASYNSGSPLVYKKRLLNQKYLDKVERLMVYYKEKLGNKVYNIEK